MNEIKLKIGDRVKHKSSNQSPSMIVIELGYFANKRGNIHCQYWLDGEFKYHSFIEEELNFIPPLE